MQHHVMHSAHGLQKKMRHTLVEGCELAEGASKGATHGGLQPRGLGGHGCQIA